jgi:hypothetical protein
MRNLGDKIANITKATGIEAVVNKVSDLTQKPCGCQQRRVKLNKWSNNVVDKLLKKK